MSDSHREKAALAINRIVIRAVPTVGPKHTTLSRDEAEEIVSAILSAIEPLIREDERRKALEEAAHMVEDRNWIARSGDAHLYWAAVDSLAVDIASSIRALQEQPK